MLFLALFVIRVYLKKTGVFICNGLKMGATDYVEKNLFKKDAVTLTDNN